MPTVSDLSVKVTSDVSGLSGLSAGVGTLRGFTAAVDRADASLAHMGGSAAHVGNSLGGLLSGLGGIGLKALEVTGAATALATALGSVVEVGEGFRLAAEFETAGVQLRALTGSATVARSALTDLRDLAANSPFAFPELLDANKRLLAVGVAAGGIPTLLREVGDVAAGTGTPIGEIADQFARVAAEGSLTTRELLALSHAGVPVVQVLAKQFHTTAAGVNDLASSGRIGFAQLQQAFESMTGPGGRFNGILAAQSQTIGGLLHNLSTTVRDTLADVAETFINAFDVRPAIAGLSAAVSRLGPAIIGGLATAAPYVRQFGSAVVTTFESLSARVLPVVSAVWSGVQTAWSAIAAVVVRYAVPIRAAVEGVAVAFGGSGLYAALGAVGSVAVALGSAFAGIVAPFVLFGVEVAAVGAVAGLLVQRFDLITRATSLLSAAAGYVTAHWRDMVTAVATAGAGVYSVVAGAFTAVGQVAGVVWPYVSGVVQAAWSAISSAASTAGTFLAGMFAGLGLHLQGFGGAFTVATAAAGFALSHLGEVAQLAAVTVGLEFAKMGGVAQYTLTTVIPAYAVWFAGNFIGILNGVYDSAKNIFTNVATAAGSTLANLPGIIRGTVHLDDIWNAIPVGFSAALTALPQIAERQAGPLESAFQATQATLEQNLVGGIGAAVAKQQAEATAAAKRVTDAISGVFGAAKMPSLPAPKIGRPDDVKVRPTLDPSSLTLGITPEVRRPKAMVSGSAESLAARFAQPTTSVAGAAPTSIAPLPPVTQPMGGAVPTSAAAPGDPVLQAQASWRDAATRARASDRVGGAPHLADQVAARSALQQLRFAQAQRDGSHRPPPVPDAVASAVPAGVSYIPPDVTPPAVSDPTASAGQDRSAAAQAFRALQDAQRLARAATSTPAKVAAQQRAQAAAVAYRGAQQRLTAPAIPSAVASTVPVNVPPTTGSYGSVGRTELTDAAPVGGGMSAVRSGTTGMSATLTDDMLANLRAAQSEGRASAGPRVGSPLPRRPALNVPDSIAAWRGSRSTGPDSVTAYRQSHADAFTLPVAPPAAELATRTPAVPPPVADVLPPGLLSMPVVPPVSQPSTPAVQLVRDESGASRQAQGDPRAAENARQLTDFSRRIEFNTRALQTNSVQTASI